MQWGINLGPARGGAWRWRRACLLLGAALGGAVAVAPTLAPPRGRLDAHAATPRIEAPLVRTAATRPVSQSPATQRFTGRVGQNLTDSLRAAGVPDLQGLQYVSVLGRAIRLDGGLSVDDRFDLILKREPGGRLGSLLYVGLARVARSSVELMKWTDGHSVIWVNGDGVGGEESSRVGLPVRGRLTSGFGNRFHPILGYERFHRGVDLAAAAGTPVQAAAEGRVVLAGWHGGLGEEVAIAHGSGLETHYGHMSRIAATIGEVVRKGQVIGWVGSTGLSTGPHVHFEVVKDGTAVNPLSAKLGNGPGHLEGEKLHEFDGALRELLLDSPVTTRDP